jgi:hypothetical protein
MAFSKKIVVVVLFFFLVGCKQENDFLLSEIEQTWAGGAYNGLLPGISSQDEVLDRMSAYHLLDPDRIPNPSITEYYRQNTVTEVSYRFFLLPKANYSVSFFFSLDNKFSRLEFRTEGIAIEDFIRKFGEPDSVIFSVTQDKYTSCDLRLFYDGLKAVVFIEGKGNVDRQRCNITETTEVIGLFMLKHIEYDNFAQVFLLNAEANGNYEDFIHDWQGYGNLFELYPTYPLISFKANQ